eukprot:CAMPEP_0185257544 /NCGR_PEP_ID=MMETSP1359-20130426/6594_1 /TAXON_ID=552665 /ORGANISM="Bigelowiella longifila, Strain CCMP242" /LENGTH=246 /DNA_ID=CAMNT_0027842691 /DNA_START=241 /DNA_END=981 /DNA_ORIENTATION=-
MMQLDFNTGSPPKEGEFRIDELFTNHRPPLIGEISEPDIPPFGDDHSREISEPDIDPFGDDDSTLAEWLSAQNNKPKDLNSFLKPSKKTSKEEEMENKIGVLREKSFDSKVSDSKVTLWEMTPPREDESGEPFKLHPFLNSGDVSPASDSKFWEDDESNKGMEGPANCSGRTHGDVLSLRPHQSILSVNALVKLQSHFMKRSVGSKRKMDSVCKSTKKMKRDFPESDEKGMAYYIANRLVKGTLML